MSKKKKRKAAPVRVIRDGKTTLIKASRFCGKSTRAAKNRYHRYLLSPAWRALREKVLERDEYRCRFCESSKNLEVHHLTYERIFSESSKIWSPLVMAVMGTFIVYAVGLLES